MTHSLETVCLEGAKHYLVDGASHKVTNLKHDTVIQGCSFSFAAAESKQRMVSGDELTPATLITFRTRIQKLVMLYNNGRPGQLGENTLES